MFADPAVIQHNTQDKMSNAQQKTAQAAVSAGPDMPSAPFASRSLPVPPERFLEYMLAIELKEAKTADEKKVYRSGIAARMYGRCEETTMAALVVEMFMTELEKVLDSRMTAHQLKFGCPQHLYEDFSTEAMQRVRAQAAASVEPEHRRLDKHVRHGLHAAAVMLLAQLRADSSAAGAGKAEERPAETRKAPTDAMAQTSGAAPQEQAGRQLPTAAPAAGRSKRPEGSSQRAASGQQGESQAAFEAIIDMPHRETQQPTGQIVESMAISVESTGQPSAEASAHGPSLQPAACDKSLHQLLPRPRGAAHAACQHSSASRSASQAASKGAASCAERSSSSSSAQGAASQGTAVPQEARQTSNKQAAGSDSSPGIALSLHHLCICSTL